MMSAPVTWSPQPGPELHNSERLAHALAHYVPLSVLDTDRDAMPGEFANLLPLDDIVYVDLSWDHRALARSPKAQVPSNEEYVALTSIRSGSEVINIDGETHRLTAGDIVLWNCQSKTLISVPSALHKSAILVPVRILDHMSLKPYDRNSLEYFTDAPTAPLLRQLLVYLGEHPHPSSPVFRRTRNALLEIALGTIESAGDALSTGFLPGLRMAVSQWIDDHIFTPDLSPRTIAVAHAVSVRTLHRAFQSEAQTLTQMMQLRKLERARDLLSDPAQTVTSVSERLNFANPSHFSRVFTRHYQMSPSEYRAGARAAIRSTASA
jgi:AraC family transcriptional regulator, positive regulator of tynA and feaB